MNRRRKIWIAVLLSIAIILISYNLGYYLADSWLNRQEIFTFQVWFPLTLR